NNLKRIPMKTDLSAPFHSDHELVAYALSAALKRPVCVVEERGGLLRADLPESSLRIGERENGRARVTLNPNAAQALSIADSATFLAEENGGKEWYVPSEAMEPLIEKLRSQGHLP